MALQLAEPDERGLAVAEGLIGRLWYSDAAEPLKGACAQMEFVHHFKRASHVRVAKLAGSFAGIVAVAPTESDSVSADEQAACYCRHLRADERFASIVGETEEEALLAVATEKSLSHEFCARKDSRSAWEITLLMVDPVFQGHGIGRRLMDDAEGYIRSRGGQGFYLATDDGCNYGFYDHLGPERICARKLGRNEEDQFHIYLYGAKL